MTLTTTGQRKCSVRENNLLILDVDGTLVQDHNSEVILPCVMRWMNKYSAQYDLIALASNQGGVGLRQILEEQVARGEPVSDDYLRGLPTSTAALLRINDIADKLSRVTGICVGMRVAYYFASKHGGESHEPADWHPTPTESWEPIWRKPNPGMIIDLIKTRSARYVTVIGDRQTDQQAAVAAAKYTRLIGGSNPPIVQFRHARAMVWDSDTIASRTLPTQCVICGHATRLPVSREMEKGVNIGAERCYHCNGLLHYRLMIGEMGFITARYNKELADQFVEGLLDCEEWSRMDKV